MLTRDQLVLAAGEMGFPSASVEKVWILVRLLGDMATHPFWGPRMALKGGTALNLFVLDLPRLSVDIDVNYIGSADRETMMADRPGLETALEQIAGRLGLVVKRAPSEHAGGKWRLSYTSALGRPAILEVDINFMLRVPLWPVVKADSPTFVDAAAKDITLLDKHELAAGKLAALIARGASRDLFDTREILGGASMDREKLRLAFVVYGGINRVDWRTVRADGVTTTTEEVLQRLLPMLSERRRPAQSEVKVWTAELVAETRRLLGQVLPLQANELDFLEGLNGRGEVRPDLLTSDLGLQERIRTQPGLQWKALNVRKHFGR